MVLDDPVSSKSSLPFPILRLRSMQKGKKKAADDPATDVQMAVKVDLWCLIEGTSSVFKVSVSMGEDVDELKVAIKERKANKLKDFDADNLRLFKVCHLPASVQLVAQQLDRSTLISGSIKIFSPSQPMIIKSR
jgi:hypothetical protein